MNDNIDQFRQAIESAGLAAPADIQPGRWIKFPGYQKGAKNRAGWCFMFDDMRGGVFGDYSTGMESNWQAGDAKPYTEAERETNRRRFAAAKVQREAEAAQSHESTATQAAQRWAEATLCTDHTYLQTKGVKGHAVKVEADGFLIVPMRDTAGKLWNIERINPADSKDKKGLYGGRRTGLYHSIGQPDGLLIVCEGYATGASIHESTGQAVAVAFNAGNLEAVSMALRGKYPKLQIIIAADDDYRTEGNPGMTKAKAAAIAVVGLVAVPNFGVHRPDGATDFNDLHQMIGAGTVKACIDAATRAIAPTAVEPVHRNQVVLISGSELTPEPVRWLWHEWLALGKLHILAGAPGQGKTTIAIAFAATITSGGRWPDGSRCDPGNVLIWSGEDDPADTLLPRLLAAGADRSRCHFVIGTRIQGEIQSFDPARDMGALELEALRIGGIKLLIVDPVVSAVTGDSHKNTEVRRALQPLVDLASRLDAAVLGISHFSKGGAGGDPATRVVGSIAFTAVARVVLVAAKVNSEDGEDRRILARGKSNIGPDYGGFEYHIEQAEPIPGIHTSYIAWGNGVAGTAQELLNEPDGQDGSGEDKSAVNAAVDFLRQVLADGFTPTKTVKENAANAGISWASVRRASDSLKVKKTKSAGAWYWSLPHSTSQGAQGVQHLNVEHLEHVEQVGPKNTTSADTETDDCEVF